MKKNIGIWIDTREAMIVTVNEEGSSTRVIDSKVETRERVEGESKDISRFGDQSIDHEKAKEHRVDHAKKHFLKKVMSELGTVDELVLFGPAGMKNELKKAIEADRSLAPKLKDVLSADSMSDKQVAALVRDYFKERK